MVALLGKSLACTAQRDVNWTFGAHIGWNFSGGTLNYFTSASNIGNPAATVSDEQGQLLFYTDGEQAWNRLHAHMPHGDTLVTDRALPPLPAPWYKYVAGPEGDGGTIIVPMPDSSSKYYLFSMTSSRSYPFAGRLYYSIIDMSLDGGLGDVDTNRKCVLLDSNLVSGGANSFSYGYQITGVSGDRCNVWLLATSRTIAGAELHAYSITGAGIDRQPVVSPIVINNKFGLGCQIVVSPDRKKLVYAANATVFDFDPYTGKIANGISYGPGLAAAGDFYKSVAFSPDNSKLYASTFGWIDQYDLALGSSPAIIGSMTRITPPLANTSGGTLKLAPDNRIYVSFQGVGSRALCGVISQPDRPGIACQFLPNTPLFAPGTHSDGYAFPNVIPLMPRRDTVSRMYADSFLKCAPSYLVLRPTDTSGWGYAWDDGSRAHADTIRDTGMHWVRYFTRPCTYRTDTFRITAYELPRPDLGGQILVCKGDEIAIPLTVSTRPGSAVTWSDGSAGASITARDTGTYWVRVTLPPCEVSDTVRILRQPCDCAFDVPNAFTPNADGKNDLFRPVIEAGCPVDNYYIQVFNRWGQKVFVSYDVAKGWDGFIDGRPAETGTYMYELHFKGGIRKIEYYRKGDLMLIR